MVDHFLELLMDAHADSKYFSLDKDEIGYWYCIVEERHCIFLTSIY